MQFNYADVQKMKVMIVRVCLWAAICVDHKEVQKIAVPTSINIVPRKSDYLHLTTVGIPKS